MDKRTEEIIQRVDKEMEIYAAITSNFHLDHNTKYACRCGRVFKSEGGAYRHAEAVHYLKVGSPRNVLHGYEDFVRS